MRKSVLAVVTTLALAGCASAPPSPEELAAQQMASAASEFDAAMRTAGAESAKEAAGVGAGVVYPGPAYAKPEVMLTKIMKAGLPFRDCDAESKYNLAGALTLHCFGDHEEQIYLAVFDNEVVGDTNTADDAGWGRADFRGKNWAVSATTKATAARAGKVLTKK